MTHGASYPDDVVRRTLEAYAQTANATEAARMTGVNERTARYWVREARAGRPPVANIAQIAPLTPLVELLDEATRHAIDIARESLDGTPNSPERAQAAAKVMHVAGNLHLDHTVGRRGSVTGVSVIVPVQIVISGAVEEAI